MNQFDEITEEITKIISWYNGLPIDYSNINELMYARIKLVTYASNFVVELGNARYNWKMAEANYEKKRREAMNVYISANNPISKAVELAKYNCINELKTEKENDGIYHQLRYIYDNICSVVDTMNQHISNLKREESQQKLSE